jgi:flagellar hook-length control protein FliK
MLAQRFLQALPRFFRLIRPAPQAAEFAAPAGPARLFVLRSPVRLAENAAKSAIGKLGPPFASVRMNNSSGNFFSPLRITNVRASATSKISSAAHYAAAQAKPNDTKTDQASPFALLVDMVTNKDAVGGRPSQKEAADSSDKGGDDTSADDKAVTVQDNQDSTPQAAAPAPARPKPEKSDKSADKDEAKASSHADPAASAVDAQVQDQQVAQQAVLPIDPQNVPPPPPIIAADAESDDLAVDTAAAAALKPQTDIKAPAPANGKPDTKAALKADPRTGTPAKTAAKPAVAEMPTVADDSADEITDLPATQTANQTAPAAPKPAAPTPAAADTQTATAVDNTGKVAQNSDASNANAPKQDTAQSAAPQDPAPKDIGTTEVAPDNAGKSAGIKNAAPKGRAAQTDTTDETAKSDQPKSDASKTAAAQPDIPNAASAPKATPHPASQAIFAVNSIAAPQAAQSSPVASATANAHVQVSTHATPDLPALAVGIVAKSQSGAKQFDIRLDPPELGRVEVRLSIDATGKASAHLSADQPQTLHLLQKDAPVLTRALRDAGLDVSQDGLNFSLRQQGENASGNAGNNGRRGSSRGFALNASVSIEATTGSAAYRAVANGRLDIRV